MIADVLAAAAQCAAGARRHEDEVDLPAQGGRHLVHRGVIVRARVALVGVLVGPESARNRPQKLLDTLDPRLEELPGYRVWLGDEVDLGPIRPQDSEVRLGGLQVHHTDETQTVIAADLGKADPHVAGARLDHHRAGADDAGRQGLFEDPGRRPVLEAPPRIQGFELGVELEAGVRKVAAQADQRCPSHRFEDPIAETGGHGRQKKWGGELAATHGFHYLSVRRQRKAGHQRTKPRPQ